MTKEVQREAAEYWADRFLPGHFEPGAAEKYGYAPRTASHEKKKRRQHRGAGIPLVYTGFARDQILRPPYIQAHPTLVRISLAAPGYFWARPPSNQPDKAAEVATVHFQEQRTLMMRMGDNAARMLREMRRTETVIITGG